MTTPTEVTKIGNLTKEPTPGEGKGTNFARFSIAVETPKEAGNWRGDLDTAYYEVTCFGSVATNACESFTKGDRVIVVGKPETDTWTGRDNQEHVTKRIIANHVGAEIRFASVQINRSEKRSSAPRSTPRPESRAVSDEPEF